MKNYYTLALLQDGVWGGEFGSYVKQEVIGEKEYHSGKKIILKTLDTQEDIKTAFWNLNVFENYLKNFSKEVLQNKTQFKKVRVLVYGTPKEVWERAPIVDIWETYCEGALTKNLKMAAFFKNKFEINKINQIDGSIKKISSIQTEFFN